jgi:nucleoside-diphosphate-sugar epimerase
MQHKRKQLIIFGCGYLGSYVAEKALAEGIAVCGVTRNYKTAELLKAKGASVIVTEIEAVKQWQDTLDPCADYILNCLSAGKNQTYQNIYIERQELILDWLRTAKNPDSTYIYTSSTGVYTQHHAQWVQETDTIGGSDKADILVAAESLVQQALTHHRRWFIMRLGGIYGPNRHYLLDALRLNPMKVPVLACHTTLNLIHVQDAARAIMNVFKAQRPLANQIYNVADNTPSDRNSILEWLSIQLNLPHQPNQLKASGTSVLASDAVNRKISNQKIKDQLGWCPLYPSFKEGYKAIL